MSSFTAPTPSLFGGFPPAYLPSSSTPATPPQPGPPKPYDLKLCAYGDVQIELQDGKQTATYLVSSHQLCSASPVFAAMLGPSSSFAEAVALREKQAKAAEEPYKLSLEDDDIHAMAVMLSVLHPRATTSTPKTMSFPQLKQMAVVCDKYDCAGAMKPWDELWMQRWLNYATEDGYEEWLSISIVFRVATVFEALTKKLVRRCIHQHSKELAVLSTTTSDHKTPLDPHTPDTVVAAIKRQRATALSTMLRRCKYVYQLYDATNAYTPKTKPPFDGLTSVGLQCKESSKVHECDYMVFANLYKCFQNGGISLSFTAESAPSLSPEKLVSRIEDTPFFPYSHVEDYGGHGSARSKGRATSHLSCCPREGLVKELRKVLESIQPLKLDAFVKVRKAEDYFKGMFP